MTDPIDSAPNLIRLRLRIGNIFIKGGEGLEIAPWENPLRLPGCTIRYVEIDPGRLTQQDHVLDNGELLTTISDGSLDFIVACHVFEHFRNPIRSVKVHLRKLRETGHLYYILPDKDTGSCDKDRGVTTFEHLIEHYEFDEPAAHCDPGHLHVWNDEAAWDFFVRCNEFLGGPYRIVHFSVNPPNKEDIVMLRKIKEPIE